LAKEQKVVKFDLLNADSLNLIIGATNKSVLW